MPTAIIPIKTLSSAKQRLSPAYSPLEREALCLYMLKSLLGAALGCKGVDGCSIVSPDLSLRDWLSAHFPQVGFIQDDTGSLDGACALCADKLKASGENTMLFFHGDLPFAKPADIEALATLSARYAAVIVPDKTLTGTNALALTPPDIIKTAFGENSFQSHQAICQRAGVKYAVMRNSGLGMDIDSFEDALRLEAQIGRV